METAPLSSAAPGRSRVALDCPGHFHAFELTVEIRSMPESLIESWWNEFRRNGNRIVKEQQKAGKGYSSLILMFRNFITNGP